MGVVLVGREGLADVQGRWYGCEEGTEPWDLEVGHDAGGLRGLGRYEVDGPVGWVGCGGIRAVGDGVELLFDLLRLGVVRWEDSCHED